MTLCGLCVRFLRWWRGIWRPIDFSFPLDSPPEQVTALPEAPPTVTRPADVTRDPLLPEDE